MNDAQIGLQNEHATPSAGDTSLCAYCGRVAVFESPTSLRKPTPEEQAVFDQDERILRARNITKSVQARRN